MESVSACTMRQRPGEGDHTQHPSGTAEQDTLRTWIFSYTQFPGKMAMERQGGRVREKGLFNKGWCTSVAHKIGGVKRRRGTAARRGLGVVA